MGRTGYSCTVRRVCNVSPQNQLKGLLIGAGFPEGVHLLDAWYMGDPMLTSCYILHTISRTVN